MDVIHRSSYPGMGRRGVKKNLRVEEVGQEMILWEDNPLQAHVLDRVQTRIYKLASEGKSVDEIEEAMRETFRIPPDQVIRPMLTDILLQFVGQGLIEKTTLRMESPPD
jgi:hypothetical protein